MLILHKSWVSQFWLQPVFSRLLPPEQTCDKPEKPPEMRLRARFPAYSRSEGKIQIDWLWFWPAGAGSTREVSFSVHF
jgi:hypothetical protein